MNLEKTHQYQREMGNAVDYYIHQLHDVYAQFRYDLTNALVLERMGSVKQRKIIHSLVRVLRNNVSSVTLKHNERLTSPIARYVSGQLEDVKAALGSAPTVQDLEKQISDEVDDVIARLLFVSPEWPTLVEMRMVNEINRMLANGEPTQAIIGRLVAMDKADGRVSIWRAGRNSLTLETDRTVWSVAAAILALYYDAGQKATGRRWMKQALAAIDHKTTDCCLKVHGQIKPLGTRFHLTGTPRFSDYQMHPGFHWRCRTSEALYLPEFEGIGVSTAEMQTAARNELQARRETRKRVVIKPAHTTSGRR